MNLVVNVHHAEKELSVCWIFLNRICEGGGSMDDLDKLEELAYMVQETSLCGLGQTAPNPVISTFKTF